MPGRRGTRGSLHSGRPYRDVRGGREEHAGCGPQHDLPLARDRHGVEYLERVGRDDGDLTDRPRRRRAARKRDGDGATPARGARERGRHEQEPERQGEPDGDALAGLHCANATTGDGGWSRQMLAAGTWQLPRHTWAACAGNGLATGVKNPCGARDFTGTPDPRDMRSYPLAAPHTFGTEQLLQDRGDSLRPGGSGPHAPRRSCDRNARESGRARRTVRRRGGHLWRWRMDTEEASHDYDRPAALTSGDTRLGGSGLRGGAVALPGDPGALLGGEAEEVREAGQRGLCAADDADDNHHDDHAARVLHALPDGALRGRGTTCEECTPEIAVVIECQQFSAHYRIDCCTCITASPTRCRSTARPFPPRSCGFSAPSCICRRGMRAACGWCRSLSR